MSYLNECVVFINSSHCAAVQCLLVGKNVDSNLTFSFCNTLFLKSVYERLDALQADRLLKLIFHWQNCKTLV